MAIFNHGDMVRCIDDHQKTGFSYPQGILKMGEVYEITNVSPWGTCRIKGKKVVNSKGSEMDWRTSRFELVEKTKPWTELIQKTDLKSWSAKCEDAYLMAIHNSEPGAAIQSECQKLLDSNITISLEDYAKAIEQVLNKCQETKKHSHWQNLIAEQKAWVLAKIIDYNLSNLTEENIDLNLLLERTKPSKTLTTKNIVNNYSETPVAKPTLIYGEDIDLMDDEELVAATEKIQARIDKLRKIPGNSKKITRQIKEAETAMAKVVEKLDADEPKE